MKVLWITNSIIPTVAKALNLKVFNSGGWIVGAASQLSKIAELQLYIASVSQEIDVTQSIQLDNINYFVLPNSTAGYKYDERLEKHWLKIQCEISPDLVHIHGTEFSYGLAWIKACGNKNVIASIQGLTSVYLRYAKGGLSNWEVLKNVTLSDIKNRTSVFDLERNFRIRQRIEKEYIRTLKHVIGRTEWDESHVMALNSKIQYHFCNETLRESFYQHDKWSFDKCERYSIFLSQAKNPIKGMHMMIKAMPLILSKFPEAKLYVANSDGVFARSFRERLRQGGYYKLLNKMANRLKVVDAVRCLPPLDEDAMVKRFLKSHVFVNASAIENSPNSLGEAQILGVPTISSFVGGTPAFMGHGKAGHLYRFEEYEMLAFYINRLFENGIIQKQIDAGLRLAEQRHDKHINVETLICIYKTVLGI